MCFIDSYMPQYLKLIKTSMAKDNKKKSSNESKRTRNYVAIGYPESLVENWQQVLTDTHIQFVISPLHDKDVITESGEIKKEHYHIMLLYEAPHTQKQAQEIFDSIGATQCQVVNSTRGTARYLLHLDNLDKAQYDQKDVVCLNGADFFELINLPTDNYQAVREMINFVNEKDIKSYYQLVDYAAMNNESWYRALINQYTMVMKEYIKSRYWDIYKRPLEAECNQDMLVERTEAIQRNIEMYKNAITEQNEILNKES